MTYTTNRVNEIVSQVRTRNQAQSVISELIQHWGSGVAFQRLRNEASFARQTTEETASRTAGNLLNSLVTRKPGGFVVLSDEELV